MRTHGVIAGAPAPALEGSRNVWSAVQSVLRTQRDESPLKPQLHERLIPLSFSQERLWFICQSQPGIAAYNIPFAWRLIGDVSPRALQEALNATALRHKIFHTVFGQTDGRPFQSLVPMQPVELRLRDFSSVSPSSLYPALQEWLREQAAEPFDLTRLPLFRVCLGQINSREFVLLLVFHHIIFDGWSRGVFFRELKAQYTASLTGTPARTPEPPLQYGDYAVWERKRMDALLEEQLRPWKQRLSAPLPSLDLPLDRARPAMPSFRGATQHFLLPQSACKALDQFRNEAQTTRFVVLLAAFNALLHRYSDQEDFIIGTGSANRNRPELRQMIGFFVNTLPLRVQPTPGMTFRELVAHTEVVSFDAFARQEVPFEKIVEAVKPSRSIGQSPLFDTMFVLQNASRTDLDLPGIQCRPMRVHNGTAKFDLTFELHEQGNEINGKVEFSTDVFEPGTVRWLARHYQMLLQSGVANPDCPIGRLPMATKREQRFLVQWNDTGTTYPRNATVHGIFETMASRFPNAMAIEDGALRWTYSEVDGAANVLAAELIASGVKPRSLVGICAERSARMIIAMLAVLKAGAAYVPLDPRYPKERLAYMVRDTQAQVLLVERKWQHVLPAHDARVVLLDPQRRAGAPPVAAAVSGDNLAYVLYTSGSTGQPKGVCVPHRAIARLVLNTNYIRITPDDVVAQAASSSFDAATFEIWGALLNGARTVVISRDVVLSPRDLATELKARGITVLFLTTALFNLMAREQPAALRAIRCVMFGGEAADPHAVRTVHAEPVSGKLLNVYGPTETTTFATWFDTRQLSKSATSVPIGLPIANTDVHVLGRDGTPSPIGVRGEVFIGGDGLADGYWNQPELTSKRFINCAVPAHGGTVEKRLYRTGDFARRLPDGNVEFLGRADNQIKIRGFRVELGEIEAALTEHEAVREAVVTVHGDSAEKRLVAYVGTKGHPVAARELRKWLADRLPEHMVPAQIAVLEALPINANGKIDRAALPSLEVPAEKRVVELKPWIPLQLQLAQIWRDLLDVKEVGLRESFFDLGGHSLLAVQLIDRIEHVCGVKLPISVLFTASTIEQLSEAILKQQFGAAKPLIEIQPGGDRTPLFFLHGDLLGGGLYCLNLARQLGSDQPFFALPPARVDGAAIPEIAAMAAEHLRVVRAFRPKGPYVLGGFCIAGLIALEMARQLEAEGEAIENLILVDPPIPSFLRTVRRYVEATSFVEGAAVERQLDRFFAGFRRVYRAKELWQANAREKLDFVRRKLSRAKQPVPAEIQTTDSRDLRAAYLWSAAGFAPVRYRGRAVLFCCDSMLAPLPKKVGAWRRITPGATMHLMPGEHLDLVTTHSKLLAEELRKALDGVDTLAEHKSGSCFVPAH